MQCFTVYDLLKEATNKKSIILIKTILGLYEHWLAGKKEWYTRNDIRKFMSKTSNNKSYNWYFIFLENNHFIKKLAEIKRSDGRALLCPYQILDHPMFKILKIGFHEVK